MGEGNDCERWWGGAREGRVEGSLNSDSDRSLCSMRGCVNVCACESASVCRCTVHSRAHTGSSATVCCGCERELSERERDGEGTARGRKGRRIGGGREREREGSIRPGQSVTMSLV